VIVGAGTVAPASEVLLGELSVVARLTMGVERLRVVVTSSRIIVAHLGKRGVGTDSAAGFLGGLRDGLEDLFRSGRESLSGRSSKTLTPDQLLAVDKDNFEISYDEIVRVTLIEKAFTSQLTILTGREKLKFFTSTKFDSVMKLLEGPLGGRLVATRAQS
jgi:hypothetical protein